MTGTVTFGSSDPVTINGQGLRDRTWGPRAVVVHTMDLNRDGAGLIDSAALVTEEGEKLTIRMRRARRVLGPHG